jgi:histone-lysine N-methyltransferase SETMAR
MHAVIRQPTPSTPQLNWEVPEHPADSPDLAPSDFHVFLPLKKSLRGRRFADDDELKERCVTGFAINHKTFIQMAL